MAQARVVFDHSTARGGAGMSQTIAQRLALARVIAAGASIRVKARKDYASDNFFAVAARRRDLRIIVQRICAADTKRRESRHAA